jgi:flagellar biosynthesis/type III secretory pathway protein FliH
VPDLAREYEADRQQIEAVLENLRTAAADVRKDLNGRIREWQRAAVELAMATATRLLHDRVVSGEFPVEEKVREMVDQLNEGGPVTIRLNPADLRLLEDRLGGEPLLPGRDDPRVVPDPTLARAEARVEGREGMVLSDVTRELTEIREQLLKDLGNARP